MAGTGRSARRCALFPCSQPLGATITIEVLARRPACGWPSVENSLSLCLPAEAVCRQLRRGSHRRPCRGTCPMPGLLDKHWACQLSLHLHGSGQKETSTFSLCVRHSQCLQVTRCPGRPGQSRCLLKSVNTFIQEPPKTWYYAALYVRLECIEAPVKNAFFWLRGALPRWRGP